MQHKYITRYVSRYHQTSRLLQHVIKEKITNNDGKPQTGRN